MVIKWDSSFLRDSFLKTHVFPTLVSSSVDKHLHLVLKHVLSFWDILEGKKLPFLKADV